MSKKVVIKADGAPVPIGPYSMGVSFGNFIFTAGQLGIDPQSGELVEGGIEAETRRALTNLRNILESVGSRMENVLKTTVYLRDIGDFGKMNAIYGEFFGDAFPARTTVQAGALPKNAAVEIEAIAFKE